MKSSNIIKKKENIKTKLSNNLNIDNQIDKINNIQNNAIDMIKKYDNITKDHLELLFNITCIAKTQLGREGKPFTKNDLVAIIMKIDPNKNPLHIQQKMEYLNTLSVSDLTIAIRCLIYDTNDSNTTRNHMSNNHSVNNTNMFVKSDVVPYSSKSNIVPYSSKSDIVPYSSKSDIVPYSSKSDRTSISNSYELELNNNMNHLKFNNTILPKRKNNSKK
jgi:hypothetical protein